MNKMDDCYFYIMVIIAISVAIFLIRLLYVLYLTGKPRRLKSLQLLSTLIVLGSGNEKVRDIYINVHMIKKKVFDFYFF